MLKDMLGVATRKLVTLPDSVLGIVCDLLEKLADPEWVEALKRFLRKENPWQEAAKLLKLITSVQVGAVKRFVAKEHIKAANIGWMGDNFKAFFLDQVEENVEASSIAVHRLEKVSLDAPILAELGDRAVISLAHFFELVEKQSKGESGQLLVNGYANVAYVIGKNGNTWAVSAAWFDVYRYWYVRAYSLENPYRWPEGLQVLSCDS